jgi:hypothetical protein
MTDKPGGNVTDSRQDESGADDDEWGEPCWECGDEGYVLSDCFDDSCCCADPETEHGYEPCPVCNLKAP